jgi:hypothetical protein
MGVERIFVLSGLGFLAGAIPLLFVPKDSSALLFIWVEVSVVVAAASVAWARSGVLKATMAAVGAVIAAFMATVIYDTTSGRPSHNVLSFELLYVMVATAMPASLTGLATTWLVSKSTHER